MEDVADREPPLKMKRLYKKGSSGEFHLIDLILGLLVLAALAYALIVYGIPWVKNLGNQGNELSDKNAEYSSEFLNDNNGDTPTESDIDDGSADTGDADPTRPANIPGQAGDFADMPPTLTSISTCTAFGSYYDFHRDDARNTQCWFGSNDPYVISVKYLGKAARCDYRFKACWYNKDDGSTVDCKIYITQNNAENDKVALVGGIVHNTNYQAGALGWMQCLEYVNVFLTKG